MTNSVLCSIPGRVLSLVGAGGKSTILYFLAMHHARLGKRVLVLTTTKIWQPDPAYFAPDAPAARRLWAAGHFAIIGTPVPGAEKLSFPGQELLETLSAEADLVLIEADGARHHPIKVPRAGEPVLLPQTDTVLCVMGLSALGQPVGKVCFGWPDPQDRTPLTEALAAEILSSPRGGRKDVGPRQFIIILNQRDIPELGAGIPEFTQERVLYSHFSPPERDFYQHIARGSLK